MSPNTNRLPAGTSAKSQVRDFFQRHRSWYRPSWIAERLSLNRETVKKICQRLYKAGLLIRKEGGFYIWHQHIVLEELRRVESFFDPTRELRVHDLFARGKVPGLFDGIHKRHNGSWYKLPWNQQGKWTRSYDLPCGSKAKLTVYANDRATVEVSSITEDPWILSQYCSFHDRINGILQEWTNQPCLFDEFSFSRLHINQDFTEISAEGPYVKTKIFRDAALAIYDKGQLGVRKEYQVEGGPGIPAKHVKKLRHLPHEKIVGILHRAEDSVQTQNLLAGATQFARQQQHLIKGNQRTILYFQDQLEKTAKEFIRSSFKDEIQAHLNLLGDEFRDLGEGVVGLTGSITQRTQQDRIVLEHLPNHQHEFEETITNKLDDVQEQQTHSLRLLNSIHHKMRIQGRGRRTREKIIGALKASQPISVKQIAEITGLSKSTIYSQLRTLVTLNVVIKIEGWSASYRLNQGRNA
ncbi:MAG: winged helix-turn-helix domain-containing protein [Candidatus Hermodarchaeota archaeon]